jgi:hypothetical protein
MISAVLYQEDNLNYMQISADDKAADDVHMLVWHLVRRRCWSSTKHDYPPECYGGLTSASEAQSKRTMQSMKTDWENLMALEQSRHQDTDALRLWEDIIRRVSGDPSSFHVLRAGWAAKLEPGGS